MKLNRTAATHTVIFLTVAVLIVGLAVWGSFRMARQQDAAEASWVEWHAQRMAEGCKIESYIGVYRAVRPIWRCPDGRAELGRVQ